VIGWSAILQYHRKRPTLLISMAWFAFKNYALR
jgi:hypothetical protein